MKNPEIYKIEGKDLSKKLKKKTEINIYNYLKNIRR